VAAAQAYGDGAGEVAEGVEDGLVEEGVLIGFDALAHVAEADEVNALFGLHVFFKS
jgi:hypothetical protein